LAGRLVRFLGSAAASGQREGRGKHEREGGARLGGGLRGEIHAESLQGRSSSPLSPEFPDRKSLWPPRRSLRESSSTALATHGEGRAARLTGGDAAERSPCNLARRGGRHLPAGLAAGARQP